MNSGAEPFFKVGLFFATTGEKPSVAVACLARIEAMRVLETKLDLLAVGLRDPARVHRVRAVRVIVLPRENTNRVRMRRSTGRLPVAGDFTSERSTRVRARHNRRTEHGRDKRLLTQ